MQVSKASIKVSIIHIENNRIYAPKRFYCVNFYKDKIYKFLFLIKKERKENKIKRKTKFGGLFYLLNKK